MNPRWYSSRLFSADYRMLHGNEEYFNSRSQLWIENFCQKLRQLRNNPQISKAYGLKIIMYYSNLYVKEYFSLPWKTLYKQIVKQILELVKILWLFA